MPGVCLIDDNKRGAALHRSRPPLEGTSTLVQGKRLALGTFDVPGTTRHQEVEVVSELVRESFRLLRNAVEFHEHSQSDFSSLFAPIGDGPL